MEPLPRYTVRVRHADPALAELLIEFSDLPADVEVRGRVMGPRCPGTSTIEVAYPLQPQPGAPSTYRVVIPEPTYWSADRPCVYSGPVELRRAGTVVGTIELSIGIAAPA